MPRPIRAQIDNEIVQEPWSGTERVIRQQCVVHVLHENGAIESHKTVRSIGCACGCLGPAGGYCAVCRQPVCMRCFTTRRCEGCGQPLCPRHATALHIDGHGLVVLCPSCGGSFKRRTLVRQVLRCALSPFIDFSSGDRRG